MQKVDQLYVLLGADAKPLKAAMKDAERAVQQAQRRSAGHLKQMDGAFTSMSRAANGAIKAMGPAAVAAIGGFFAVATVRAFNNEVQQSIDKLDAIGKTADRLGLSTDALQELRHAAELSGVEVATFDMAMQRFTRRAAEAAQGTGEAKAALQELGIQLRDNNGNLRSSEDLLDDVADAMSGVQNQGDRVRLAMKLFDSEGVKLVNMLQSGSAAMDKMRQDARDLGLVFDEALIRKSTESKDKLDVLWKVIDAKVTVVFAEMADELVEIVSVLADFVKWVTEGTVELLKFLGVINRVSSQGVLEQERDTLRDVVRGLQGKVVRGVGLTDQEKVKLRLAEARLQELEAQLATAATPAASPSLPAALGAGSGAGKATRDPLAELAKNMEAQRRIFETLAMTSQMPGYSGLTDQVKLATEVVEQLGSAGLNLSDRFANGFAGATDQVLAWMGVLDQANIATGDLTDRERELGERIAQEALWREELKQQYEEFLTLRERDKELNESLAEFDQEMAQGDQFEQELARLEEQYEKRLELLKEARGRELQTEEEFRKRQAALEADHAKKTQQVENDRYALMLHGAASTFGQIASATRLFAGEQSGIYRAMFFTSKAFAIAESVIKIQQAMAEALSLPFPANLGAMATVAAQGASILGVITSVTAGFQRGGYTGDGGTGQVAGVVHGKEFVVNAAGTAQHRALLEQINAGRMPALPAVPQMGGAMAAAGASPQIQFNVINEAGGLVRAEVDPRQPNTVRVREIARDEVLAGAGDAAARDLRDPDSNFSKALGSLTTARRSR